MAISDQPVIHSTRLFPKNLGANRYEITGIADRCDWVVLSDATEPQIHLVKRKHTTRPQTIFLSMRAHEEALIHFAGHLLPDLKSPFVLITGSEDITLPQQFDKRWPALSPAARRSVGAILDHPCLRYWFAENLDQPHPLMSPLPLGMVFSEAPKIQEHVPLPNVPKLSDRPLSVLCGHRVRKGPQWATRRYVSDMARTHWADWTHALDRELPESEFLQAIQRNSFVLCVEGGGLDPSPKAWQAILHGAIPIIRRTALDEAYAKLPVIFVDDWHPESITRDKLEMWQANMTPHFDWPRGRAEVLARLSLDFWWDIISNTARGSWRQSNPAPVQPAVTT